MWPTIGCRYWSLGVLMFTEMALSFDDVLLVPQHSKIRSRSSIDLTVELENVPKMALPIFSAPMDTVTGSRVAYEMTNHGGIGIVHRYNTPEEQALIVSSVMDRFDNEGTAGHRTVGAAVGVSGDYLSRAEKVFQAGARILCVDVAHGDHVLALDAVRELRKTFGDRVHIMAGNVATLEGFDALAAAGANSIRVGIGGGSICSTRIQTGHGVPTLQSVIDCSRSSYAGDVKLIADGGIKNSGDIVKAYAAGADAVMVGSLLSGTDESPGKMVVVDGKEKRTYRGMASVEAQIDWRGHAASEEGVSAYVDPKGPLSSILKGLAKGIRSGFSYSGCTNLREFHAKAKFIRITASGMSESKTHILD